MEFTKACVTFVIWLIILLVTSVLGAIIDLIDDSDYWTAIAWLLSSTGFAVCLALLLFKNGII